MFNLKKINNSLSSEPYEQSDIFNAMSKRPFTCFNADIYWNDL